MVDAPELENGDLPLWARLIIRHGITTAIAAFLIWFITQDISKKVNETHDDLRAHMQEQRFFLRSICMNTSHDDAQRAQCIPPGER